MSSHSSESEAGSGLIWFISLLALVSLLSGTLVSASHEYLFARKVTDYAEEFALAVTTKMNMDSSLGISETGRSIFLATEPQYNFTNLRVRSIDLQPGQTVHVVICATWTAPFSMVTGSKDICEQAFAR